MWVLKMVAMPCLRSRGLGRHLTYLPQYHRELRQLFEAYILELHCYHARPSFGEGYRVSGARGGYQRQRPAYAEINVLPRRSFRLRPRLHRYRRKEYMCINPRYSMCKDLRFGSVYPSLGVPCTRDYLRLTISLNLFSHVTN